MATLAAVNVTVLPVRGIRQPDVEALVGLDNKIRALMAERDALAEKIMKRLEAGEKVEGGSYAAELVTRGSGGKRSHRLVIR